MKCFFFLSETVEYRVPGGVFKGTRVWMEIRRGAHDAHRSAPLYPV